MWYVALLDETGSIAADFFVMASDEREAVAMAQIEAHIPAEAFHVESLLDKTVFRIPTIVAGKAFT